MAKKKLTPGQVGLYKAMESGVEVFFISGLNAYYFRGDTLRNCTKQATGLVDKGWAVEIKRAWNGHELALTPATQQDSAIRQGGEHE